eukprot:3726824-Prymnesium_polylepis.1
MDHESTQILSFQPSVIAREYLKSWFWIDFLSSLPIDFVLTLSINGCDAAGETATCATNNATNVTGRLGCRHSALDDDESGPANLDIFKMIRILRMIKLLKIMRILKLQARLEEMSDRIPILSSTSLFVVLKLLMIVGYLSHIIACGWYFVGTWRVAEKREMTWSQLPEPYVASMYWTIMTISTVGYGDLVPSTVAEQAYAILAMLIGTTLFGFVMGSAAAILSTAELKNVQITKKRHNLEAFLADKQLSRSLQVRIRRHFRFFWQRSLTVNDSDDEILGQLTSTLHHETLQAIYTVSWGSAKK